MEYKAPTFKVEGSHFTALKKQAAFPSKTSYTSPQDMAPRSPTLQLPTSRCEDHNSQTN